MGSSDTENDAQHAAREGAEFLEGVTALYLSLDDEEKSGNFHCLKKNRTKNYALDWVERSVVTRILMKKFLAEALVGNNSHCHPTKDVPPHYLESISTQTRIHSTILQKRVYDIAVSK